MLRRNQMALYRAAATSLSGPPAPAAPSLLGVTPGDHKNDLAWTDNSSDEDAFAIFRDGVEVATTAANATTYSDTGLTNGVLYSYVVKSRKTIGGDSAASNTATGTPVSSLSTGLVEFWKLADLTGVNGNTLTLVGSVPFSSGTATFTANTANALTRAAQTWGVSTDCTVAVRFTTTSLAADQTPLQFGLNPGTATGNVITINFGPSGQYIYIVGATGTPSGEKQWGATPGTQLGISAGVLTQLVITVSGATVLVYSQGSDITAGLTKTKNTALTMSDTSRPFRVGQGNFGGGSPYQPMNGSVASIGYWSRALTAGEVTTLYNGGVDLEHPF